MKTSNINLNVSSKIFNEVYFQFIFDYQHRYEIYYGGSGSGKSHFITQKLILKALKSKRKILVIRKVGRTLKESVFQLFLDILSQFKILSLCNVNRTDFTIRLPNDSVILFKGLDDSEKIKSIAGISDVWVEECTEINLNEFTQLDLRLRSTAPYLQYFLSFNPVSKANWVYKKYFSDEVTLTQDTFVLKTTYKHNKYLPKDYINALEEMIKTNPTYYKIYAKGEFCSLDKLIYNNWEVQDFCIESLKTMTDLKLLIGLDFGFVSDPTALISSLIDLEQRKIYIFDEFVQRGLTNDKVAEIIKYKGLSKSVIIADCAEEKSIKEIKDFGIRKIQSSKKGSGSVNAGIDKLQQYKIIVHSSCVNTITELQNYAYIKDKNSNEYTNKPMDKFNHCMDALRYSLQCLEQNKLKTMKKSLLGL